MKKTKAILVVSFGTTYTAACTANIGSVENKISFAFPDYTVRRAFTSRIVVRKLFNRDGIIVDTEKQALDRLQAEGYSQVIIQPLHIIPGDEYDKVSQLVSHYIREKTFANIVLGRPILYYSGQENKPDDYLIAVAALQTQIPQLGNKDAILFMGHGGMHPANAAYAALQLRLQDSGFHNIFIFTVDGEGYPTLESVIQKLKKQAITQVMLMPLMLVAGDHAINDMAADDPSSAKSQLLAAGFQVETYLYGLGENPTIQNIYVQHVQDALENKYDRYARGHDRPPIPVIE
ncbi:MAG TPA: sirohydrochlorin cobaltochelatase [Patescibacteria group bacterium]|nr:sirohydrochlorin cobaltochelatase [Patescibacteria group bacterium]